MYQFIRAKNNEKHSCIKNIHIKVVSCTNHLISLSYLWNKLVSLFTKNWLLHLKNYPIPIHIKIKVIIISLHFKYNNYISSFGLGKKITLLQTKPKQSSLFEIKLFKRRYYVPCQQKFNKAIEIHLPLSWIEKQRGSALARLLTSTTYQFV